MNYYCRAISGDQEKFYYGINYDASNYKCDQYGCNGYSPGNTVGTLTALSPGGTFDSIGLTCWAYDYVEL